jgi:SAM-dependent methyltransferase
VINKSALSHYNLNYFQRQSAHGRLGAIADLFKFEEYIQQSDTVIDFGCGGGFLLAALHVNERIGVEVNDYAVKQARQQGFNRVYKTIDEVPAKCADVLISNHALEHVENPFHVMEQFLRVLKIHGKVIIVTPYDSISSRYREDDPDYHLFGWSPSNLGNLARAAGFHVLEAKEIRHFWPPQWHVIIQRVPVGVFHLICTVYGFLHRSRSQVRLIAVKPSLEDAQ